MPKHITTNGIIYNECYKPNCLKLTTLTIVQLIVSFLNIFYLNYFFVVIFHSHKLFSIKRQAGILACQISFQTKKELNTYLFTIERTCGAKILVKVDF